LKKIVYSLNVNGYAPEITEITFPLIDQYATKIGAEFKIICDREFPDMPPVYEKVQLYELSKESDWTIYIDADTLIRPDFPDITPLLNKDTVCFHGRDFSPVRFDENKYFRRDGRWIGACNWFTIASDWCSDLWHPLETPIYDVVKDIHPCYAEAISGVIEPNHLIDDYLLSFNIARYGLKHTTMMQIFKDNGDTTMGRIWHEYLMDVDHKVVEMKKILKIWGLL
jgi:hypothetical protein